MTTAVKDGHFMERKTIRISDKRQLTIPLKFFETLGFSSEAECILRGNELVLRPVRQQDAGEFDEQILADLIAQGYTGQKLLSEFKSMRKKIRPAVQAMLHDAEKAADGQTPSYSYQDIFGEDSD